MQHARYPEVDPAFGNWLAGFADGEGCFVIGSTGGRSTWQFAFRIRLRLDDRAVLDEIHERTALGRVFGYERRERAGRATTHPTYSWIVYRKQDVGRLIELFDAFPLRAKKARDYAIWREAACYWLALDAHRMRRYSSHRGSLSHDWGPIPALAAELRAVRKYREPSELPARSVPPVGIPQLF